MDNMEAESNNPEVVEAAATDQVEIAATQEVDGAEQAEVVAAVAIVEEEHSSAPNKATSENAQAEQEAQPEEEEEAATPSEIAASVEAILFTCGDSISKDRLEEILSCESKLLEEALELLRNRLDQEESGLEMVQVAGKYLIRTKPIFAELIRTMKTEKPRRLSPAALETLSVIAYRQPIVKSDVEKLRGVDVTPTLKTLLERKLVKIVGHQSSVGQPALYGTTEEFLKIFGLRSLAELPTLRDLNELEKDPGETPEGTVEKEAAPQAAVANA